MIDPARVAFFIPPELKKFKLDLFNRVGAHIQSRGGKVIRGDVAALKALSPDMMPIVGCTPALTPLIAEWRRVGRRWVYWDRGYCRRVFATWLPRGENGGFYRWHVGSHQMQELREVSDDRWKALKIETTPWRKSGKHVVIAMPTKTYARFHQCEAWTDETLGALARLTERQIVIRDKESRRPLQYDLDGAHALVSHGSIAAVESVVLGCPVFVHPDSAAALVGRTDLSEIERPVYPDREPWLNALAYSQFNETELVNGTLWKLIA